jgi:hypothetical protein
VEIIGLSGEIASLDRAPEAVAVFYHKIRHINRHPTLIGARFRLHRVNPWPPPPCLRPLAPEIESP